MADKRITALEKVIETNQKNFYQIGKALKQIRDEQLFRDLLFDRFETYVKDRWDMARSQAYRLIEAANVIDNLSPIGDGILPENEAQTRILAGFNKGEQRKIWRGILSSGTKLTAVNIRKFAKDKAFPIKRIKPSPLIDVVSTHYKEAVMAMLSQIRLAKNSHWQTTSKEAALFWHKVMKENIEFGHEKRK